jgi:putative hemolysin
LRVIFARTEAEVREAQRLRYVVFAEERAARLAGAGDRLDADRFDRHCRHLLVVDGATDAVVGTYRILDYDGSRAAGGFYSETEFDTGRIRHLAPWTVEIGRACVHPSYRSGVAIALLWGELMRHILLRGYQFIIGCASVETAEGGHVAASICRQLLTRHLGPEEWRVFPHRAFVLEGWADIPGVQIPGLIRAYLRLGCQVCGDPSWDPEFKTADLLMMLPLARLNTRYAERIVRDA